MSPPPLKTLDEPNLEALVELMFLAAFADGEFSQEEKVHFARSVESLTDRRIPQSTMDELIHTVVTQLQQEGRAARLASLKERLPSPQARKVAFSLAAQVVVADGIVRTSERELLLDVAAALEIEQTEAADVVRRLAAT
ncbi:MAG TPA: tellurite resistance TerB family protein [Sorangium sp.]|uniref:tellurite resistance TerB family protein n=1 Tax=unclassified Sorangium TaxID=2621164 RepID=UPI002B770C3E|nr:tellurite resistance TerB family protein [Sorangium sp.]